VLTGDLNAKWDDSIAALSTSGLWRDAWRERGRGEEEGWTFRSWERESRIDYVLVRDGRLVVNEVIVEGANNVSAAGLEPVGGVADMKDVLFASDHLFLYASLGRAGSRSMEEHAILSIVDRSSDVRVHDDL